MPSVASTIQALALRAGLDVRRRRPEFGARIAQVLRRTGVELVLDVGANHGQYGSALRRHGYPHQIISFEPLVEPFRQLVQNSADDPRWKAYRCALGAVTGAVQMHVAANDGASSSVLPMKDRHVEAAPGARYVGLERVHQDRLDDFLAEHRLPAGPAFLKLDVQGYEGSVLAGSEALLSSRHLMGLQIEVSFVELYEGGLTWAEALALGGHLGMDLALLEPEFAHPRTGQLLQADAIFARL
jgi:FkbM family methyltransferase